MLESPYSVSMIWFAGIFVWGNVLETGWLGDMIAMTV